MMGALAGFVGSMVGMSLSPEMWIAVAIVVWRAKSLQVFVFWWAIMAAALTSLHALIIPDVPREYAWAGAAALALWSAIGWGVRAIVQRRRSPVTA